MSEDKAMRLRCSDVWRYVSVPLWLCQLHIRSRQTITKNERRLEES